MAELSMATFGDLGEVGPVRFQGGVIFLRGYGCYQCGNGFWTLRPMISGGSQTERSTAVLICGEASETTVG